MNLPKRWAAVFSTAIVFAFASCSDSPKIDPAKEREILVMANRTSEMFLRAWMQGNFEKAANTLDKRTKTNLDVLAQKNSGRGATDALAALLPMVSEEGAFSGQIQCISTLRHVTAKKNPMGCELRVVSDGKEYSTAQTVLLGRNVSSECTVGLGRRQVAVQIGADFQEEQWRVFHVSALLGQGRRLSFGKEGVDLPKSAEASQLAPPP